MSVDRRVVVTGLGAVTPLGTGVETFWRRLVAGGSGVRYTTAFDPSRVPSRMAGEVPDFDPSGVLDRKEVRRNDRCTQLALVATAEALEDAGLPRRLEGELAEATGALVGSGLGGAGTLIEQVAIWATRGPDRVSPFFIPMAIANMPAGLVSITFGVMGPCFSTTSACASGGHALGEASEMIKRGDADVMLAGGAEAAVYEATVAAFAAMRALSTRNDDPAGASRPFDGGRDGFVVAEGAAMLVLEELEHALARGVRIYAEVLGYSATADANHITSPAPGGAGGLRAMRRALARAGLGPGSIDLVSAHATSTPDGNLAELQAIQSLVGEHVDRVSVTAQKASIGHTLGAAGAIAAVAAIKAMQESCVPPTINLVDPDPQMGGLDCTPLVARQRPVDVALLNAFGFGGQNSAIVMERWGAP
jgi:3-oxoacyl-[acyl-carrier-protein] synthase II